MKLVVVAVGRLREKNYADACAAYCKRMATMLPVEVVEVEEAPIADEGDPVAVGRALDIEGRRIQRCLREGDLVIALAPDGKTMDSVAFSRAILSPDPLRPADQKRCVFIVGSSHGLAPAVYARAQWKLSFGPMTFPHQLARLMLLEQLYRAQMIGRGAAYHK